MKKRTPRKRRPFPCLPCDIHGVQRWLEDMAMKYIYRLPPCPAYDITGMEGWLNTMAQNGLFLHHFTAGLAAFIPGSGNSVRYRLDVAPPEPALGLKLQEQAEAQRAFYAQAGWEYIGKHGDFAVYRADDPRAAELHTDPKVRAMSLEAVSKWARGVLFRLFWWMVIYGFLLQHYSLVKLCVRMGAGFTLLGVGLLAGYTLHLIKKVLTMRRLRRWLTAELPLGAFPGNTRSRHRAWAVTSVIASVLFAGFLVTGFLRAETLERHPLSATAKIPFATLDRLDSTLRFEPWDSNSLRLSNWYTEDSNTLSRRSIDLMQSGTFYDDSGTEEFAILRAEYYETVSPLLARAMAWELEWDSRSRLFNTRYQHLDAPTITGADYVSMYYDQYGYATLVLVRGGTLLAVELGLDDTAFLSAHAQAFTDSLIKDK